MSDVEEWYHLAHALIGPLLGTVSQHFKHRAAADFHLSQVPTLALYHLASCLDISGTANERGYHAVAIALTRQAIEALTVVELGLIEPVRSAALLASWDGGQRSQGQIRRELERHVWPTYGPGLWGEPWPAYVANLARAVQPYAHYTPELLQWQFAALPSSLTGGRFLATAGPGTSDAVKGHRVSLLHALTIWSLGRALLANVPDIDGPVTHAQVERLGRALARSRLLIERADWGTQLWPHMFLK